MAPLVSRFPQLIVTIPKCTVSIAKLITGTDHNLILRLKQEFTYKTAMYVRIVTVIRYPGLHSR